MEKSNATITWKNLNCIYHACNAAKSDLTRRADLTIHNKDYFKNKVWENKIFTCPCAMFFENLVQSREKS